MYKFDNEEYFKGRSPQLLLLLFLVAIVFLAAFVQLILVGVYSLLNIEVSTLLASVDPQAGVLLGVLNTLTIGLSMGGAVFLLLKYEKKSFNYLSASVSVKTIGIFISALFLVIYSKTVAEYLAIINQKIDLPEFMVLQQEQNDSAVKLMLSVLDYPMGVFLLIIFMAIVPAFFEEIVFRGVLQNLLHRITSNVHVSIFVAGFIFSAIHFQFAGFLPRMFLGVVLGYMYYWSRNIWLPIFGHFCFNGSTLLTVYLAHQKGISIDAIANEVPQVESVNVLLSVFFFVLLLFFYQRNCWISLNRKQES